ncbi:MAG: NAD(P)-dependent glycerol-3-phosphate dehydrogenase [Clostridia bacterium]|nr:NAD(P)-dependent glycerol-3-phosphate dehydrogenase [Clostridia bacterium]
MRKICIIGSGSWGCALAIHSAKMGHKVKIWSFDEEEAKLINEERKCKFLPKVTMPENIYCTTNIKEAVEETELILHVTPSKFFRETLKKYKEYITNQPVIICSKGFELDTLSTLSDVAKQEIPNVKIGAFSGPSHAEEVSLGIPTAIVVASKDYDVQYKVQDAFMNEVMRVYTTTDIQGVELGGALKNIIAFCAGVAAELNLGDNSFAALISRGLTEISRLGVAMGGEHNTFYGLSGLGDLIVTCMSEHSRNRKAGRCIGRGLSVEETRKEVGMVIESIDNIEVAYKLAQKYNIEMPIVNTVYDVLYHKLSPKEAVTKLMTREKKCE